MKASWWSFCWSCCPVMLLWALCVTAKRADEQLDRWSGRGEGLS